MNHTTVAQIKLDGAGMSYAIQLPCGSFILIDGGIDCDTDRARLYRYLCERTKVGPPTVAAWLFTHGHHDHIALAAHFMTEYRDAVRIERILYNIPSGDFCGYDAGGVDGEYEEKWFLAVKCHPDAMLHEVKTGEVFECGGARIEVLTSAEERYPDPPTNRNETSAVYKLTFENGRSFMVLGDAWGDRLVHLLDPASPIFCPDEVLRSDLLQVAHHGLAVCSYPDYPAMRELYRKISPSVCFWPTSAARFYNDPWCRDEKHIYNRFLLEHAGERNFHLSETVEVDTEDMSITVVE